MKSGCDYSFKLVPQPVDRKARKIKQPLSGGTGFAYDHIKPY